MARRAPFTHSTEGSSPMYDVPVYENSPSNAPRTGRGLKGPHAAIWIAVIVCGTIVALCVALFLFCGGMAWLGSTLPAPTPTPTP